MEKLTCGFHLVNNGSFGRCGNSATHQIYGNLLCDQCARYMKMRGLPVTKMRKSTIESKLRLINKVSVKEAVAV